MITNFIKDILSSAMPNPLVNEICSAILRQPISSSWGQTVCKKASYENRSSLLRNDYEVGTNML